MNEVRPLVSGRGHLFDRPMPSRYAMRYFEADVPSSVRAPDQATIPSPVGPQSPALLDSSQDYIDEHEKATATRPG